MHSDLSAQERRTLRFAPLWVLSGIAGVSGHYHPLLLEAFWDRVDEAASRAQGLTRLVLTEMAGDRAATLGSFEREAPPIASGLGHVVDVLSTTDEQTSLTFRTMLVDLGEEVARARGPFGRSVTRQDDETLQLLAQLLELETVDDEPLEVLV